MANMEGETDEPYAPEPEPPGEASDAEGEPDEQPPDDDEGGSGNDS